MDEIKWLLGVVVDVVVQFDRDEARALRLRDLLRAPSAAPRRWDDAVWQRDERLRSHAFSSWSVDARQRASHLRIPWHGGCWPLRPSLYLSGSLFLLLNKASPGQAQSPASVLLGPFSTRTIPGWRREAGSASITVSGISLLVVLPAP
jgi:hypothetical protein